MNKKEKEALESLFEQGGFVEMLQMNGYLPPPVLSREEMAKLHLEFKFLKAKVEEAIKREQSGKAKDE